MMNRQHTFGFVLLTSLCLIASLFCLTSTVAAQEGSGIKPPTVQQEDGSRQIVAEEFTKGRPIKPPTFSATATNQNTGKQSGSAASHHHYKRTAKTASNKSTTTTGGNTGKPANVN